MAREASEPSFSPEKTILQQAIWFPRGATDEHLVLPLAWMGAKSEEEKNNNNAARGCQARACTRCDRHWAESLALLHLMVTTRTVGLVTPHSADGESEAQGGDKAAGKRQDQDEGPGLPNSPRGPGSRSPLPDRWRCRLSRAGLPPCRCLHKEGRQLEEEPYGPHSRLPLRHTGTRPHLPATLGAENIYIQIHPDMPYFCLKQTGSLSSPTGRR